MKNTEINKLTSAKFITLTLSVALIALAGNVYGQKIAPSQGPISVKVVNAGSEPVPVTGAITVANLGTATIPVRDIENPANQPVQAQSFCAVETNGCPSDLYEVPAGKRLVIEYVSMRALIPVGQVAELEISTVLAGQTGVHLLNMTPPSVNTSGGIPRASVAQQVRLYADPGTKVKFVGLRNSSDGPAGFFYSFSGYLVDVK